MDRLSAPLPYPSFKLPWGHVLDEICSLATSMLSLLGVTLIIYRGSPAARVQV